MYRCHSILNYTVMTKHEIVTGPGLYYKSKLELNSLKNADSSDAKIFSSIFFAPKARLQLLKFDVCQIMSRCSHK